MWRSPHWAWASVPLLMASSVLSLPEAAFSHHTHKWASVSAVLRVGDSQADVGRASSPRPGCTGATPGLATALRYNFCSDVASVFFLNMNCSYIWLEVNFSLLLLSDCLLPARLLCQTPERKNWDSSYRVFKLNNHDSSPGKLSPREPQAGRA